MAGTFFYGAADYEYDGCQNGGICWLMNMVGSPFVFEPEAGSYSVVFSLIRGIVDQDRTSTL